MKLSVRFDIFLYFFLNFKFNNFNNNIVVDQYITYYKKLHIKKNIIFKNFLKKIDFDKNIIRRIHQFFQNEFVIVIYILDPTNRVKKYK